MIGVHSPKYAAEKDECANVAQAIARYDIRPRSPHDPDFNIWNAYAVRAWPTLVSYPRWTRGRSTIRRAQSGCFDAGGCRVLEAYRAEGSLKPGTPPAFAGHHGFKDD